MNTAIVFIKTDVSQIPEVAEKVTEIPGVTEVYSVTGTIDLIAIVRCRNYDDIATIITRNINKVPGVVSTETHIAFQTYSKHDLEAAFAIGH